ncbi:MAG: Gfo/Idh/MocA family protein, partial [Blastocatellia bacterium]
MASNNTKSRREFLKLAATGALVAGAAPMAIGKTNSILTVPSSSNANYPAGNRIGLATIGVGGQGTYDTHVALRVPGVELVAAADVYDGRLTRVKEVFGDHVFTTRDYREVLARPDVDAVICGTSDHHHMEVSIDAMAAGKHVYCEKPMVHSLDEGRRIIEAAKKYGKVFQVGSQRVSSVLYKKAQELLESGAIGELNLVEAWWDRNSAIGAWQYSIPPDASPQTVDWDRFIGTAPKRAFEPVRMFRWRNYRDYGTGVAGDLFVHLFSGLHFITGSTGPTRVMTTGGLRYWKDGRDVPDVMMGLYDYPSAGKMGPFNLTLKVDFADGAGETSGLRFIGSEGVMSVGGQVTLSRKPRSFAPGYTIDTFPKAVQEEFLKQYREKYPEGESGEALSGEQSYSAPQGYNDSFDHFTNFFDAIRS